MSEIIAPLNGAAFDGLLRVDALGPQGQITLRGDFAAPAFRDVVTEVAGTAFPEARRVEAAGDRALLWMSPDELMLLLPYEAATTTAADLAQRLSGEHALAVDVSDARAHFRLRGAPLRDVLAKITPADVSPAALPEGELRRTRLAQIAAAVWLTGPQEARLFCFRSVAQYAFDLLSTAAAPGSEVGYFDGR
ncbi:sarcosine oxidase subunit gamma [Salipiger mucosus]|uniref:Sarcosine oxidase gamma subunit n=1 Tax=Salipiger mucosus DSM 16094 TaxID=1123237 RepID=S9QP19_9RHOB|nr:sarcosine oxidase subunit gamma family protein [Salipiger mucosus]EPX81427.1 Sarcosine oxidase gamma subunit [Salipiger mucosus DSM 16094]